MNLIMEHGDEIFVKCDTKGKLVRIVLAEIAYIEAALNYVIIHLDDGKHCTYLTLTEVKEVLDSSVFVQIHKSYVINRSKIYSLEGGSVILKNQVRIFIGGRYKEAFLKSINTRLLISKRH